MAVFRCLSKTVTKENIEISKGKIANGENSGTAEVGVAMLNHKLGLDMVDCLLK